MDMFAALDRATAQFADLLCAVQDTQWQWMTPDPDWSVHDLVNHVVGGNRRYLLLLSGAPTTEVEELRHLDHLGNDPLAAFRVTAAEVTDAFHQPGAMTVTVHHRHGDRSGAELLTMRVVEHAVHGWDLARATGQDDRIDPGVVAALLAATEPAPGWFEGSGYAAPTPPTDADLGEYPQARLLRRSGRSG